MKARRWAPILFGVAVFVVFVILGAGVFGIAWVRDHLDITPSSAADAEAAFDEVRQRYRDKAPLLELSEAGARTNRPPDDAPRTTLTTLHVLAFDADEGRLARFDLPFWFLRLKEGPIRFGTYASGLDGLRISLTAADLERYGPGIVVDVGRGDERALLWVN
ncbi:MAG: hypothetical protein AB7Q16_13180 [Vicinamibacterales bacterium]